MSAHIVAGGSDADHGRDPWLYLTHWVRCGATLLTPSKMKSSSIDGFVCGGRGHRFGQWSGIPVDEILEPMDFH